MKETGTIIAHIKKNHNMKYFIVFLFSFSFIAGAFAQNKSLLNLNDEGTVIKDRVEVPDGYIRPPFPESSFQNFLRSMPMKKAGAKVMKYDGYNKFFDCYAAVVDMDFPMESDVIHSEHTIQLIRSLYFYKTEKYDLMRFSYDDNRNMDFFEYGSGIRFVWQDSIYVKEEIASEDFSINAFNNYLGDLYGESTTRGLKADTREIEFGEMSVGDLLLQPGNQHSKGHTVMVMDMAIDPLTGERLVLFGQGFEPTQDFHIIDNPYEEDISPWYRVDEDAHFFSTIQWTFRKKHCRRFLINANAESYLNALQLLEEEETEE